MILQGVRLKFLNCLTEKGRRVTTQPPVDNKWLLALLSNNLRKEA